MRAGLVTLGAILLLGVVVDWVLCPGTITGSNPQGKWS